MEIVYQLVTMSEKWLDECGFHQHYFTDLNIFAYCLLAMLAIGVAACVLFYLTCCNNESNRMATTLNCWIALAVALVVAFLVSKFAFFGGEESGFVASSETFLNERMEDPDNPLTDSEKGLWTRTYENIKEDVSNGDDVELMFDLTNVVLALIAFCGTSFVVRRYTVHGSKIFLF